MEGTSTPLIFQQEVTLEMASVGPVVAEKAMGPSNDETQGCCVKYDNTRHSPQENLHVDEVTTQSDSGLDPAPSQADFSAHTETADGKAVKRKRRKRAFFHAMSVMDASKQNAKTPDTDQEKKLRQGDLIREMNGVRTCGLPFSQHVSSLLRAMCLAHAARKRLTPKAKTQRSSSNALFLSQGGNLCYQSLQRLCRLRRRWSNVSQHPWPAT
jgi:hypothetical protein